MNNHMSNERFKELRNVCATFANGFLPTLKECLDEIERLRNLIGGGMVYERVCECLETLKPLKQPGRGNTLIDLTRQAMERIKELEQQLAEMKGTKNNPGKLEGLV